MYGNQFVHERSKYFFLVAILLVLSSVGAVQEDWRVLRRSPWPAQSFQERLPCSFSLINFMFSLCASSKQWPGHCVQSHTHPGPSCHLYWAMWLVLGWEHPRTPCGDCTKNSLATVLQLSSCLSLKKSCCITKTLDVSYMSSKRDSFRHFLKVTDLFQMCKCKDFNQGQEFLVGFFSPIWERAFFFFFF